MFTFAVHGCLLFALASVALVGVACREHLPAPPLSSDGVDPETQQRIDFYRSRVDRDPFDFIARNRLGENYLQRARETGRLHDYAFASELFAESLELMPRDNPAAIDGTIRVRLSQHRFRDALEMSQCELRERPHDAQLWAYAGDAHLELGNLAEAERAYEMFATRRPGLAAWSRMARVAGERGRTEEALAFLERARNAYPNAGREPRAWTWIQSGELHLQRGAVREARHHFVEALRLLPNSHPALERLAESFEIEGELTRAQSYRDAARRIREASTRNAAAGATLRMP